MPTRHRQQTELAAVHQVTLATTVTTFIALYMVKN